METDPTQEVGGDAATAPADTNENPEGNAGPGPIVPSPSPDDVPAEGAPHADPPDVPPPGDAPVPDDPNAPPTTPGEPTEPPVDAPPVADPPPDVPPPAEGEPGAYSYEDLSDEEVHEEIETRGLRVETASGPGGEITREDESKTLVADDANRGGGSAG